MGKKKRLEENLSDVELEFIDKKMKGDNAFNYLTSEGLCTKLKTLNYKLNIKCKNQKQKNFLKHLQDLNIKLNICDAPAGVGKSLLALTAGLFLLKNGDVSKILVIVPTVEASEATKIGLLPWKYRRKNQTISDGYNINIRKNTKNKWKHKLY